MTVMEILHRLPFKLTALDDKTRKRYMTDTDRYWDYKEEEYPEGIVILDIPPMTKYVNEKQKEKTSKKLCGVGVGEELEDFWSNRVAGTVVIAKGMGQKAGTIPGSAVRSLKKSKKKVVDWKRVLHEFVQEEVADYSFNPPDRRYANADFFLPDFNEKEYVPKDVLFMADTSGSVRMDALSKVFAEICSAVEQFDGKLNGKLGFFDCEVTAPVPFQSVEEVNAIIPYGGGGTSFEVVFDYIREHMDELSPALIVIFTDGYAKFPEEGAAMNIPVLWLILNDDVTPPWGRVGRIVD